MLDIIIPLKLEINHNLNFLNFFQKLRVWLNETRELVFKKVFEFVRYSVISKYFMVCLL